MKQTEAASKIDTLSIVKTEIEATAIPEELSLSVTVALLDSAAGPGLLGRSLHKGPWPADVLDMVKQLRDRVEEHLLSVYFEVGNDRPNRTATGRPVGIVEPELGSSQADTPQL